MELSFQVVAASQAKSANRPDGHKPIPATILSIIRLFATQLLPFHPCQIGDAIDK